MENRSPLDTTSSERQVFAQIKNDLGTLSEMYAIYNSLVNIAISIASLK